jgi:glycosyl transferase family 25
MSSRVGDWAPHFERFTGTNGHTINVRSWYNQKKLALRQMKRGRIGCYDSHVRVWKTIQQSEAPFALVLEDDADIRYSTQHASRIQGALNTLKGRPWDVLLLGHYNDRKYTQGLGNGITKATKWQPMHAYLISQSGIKKLLKNAWPIRHALDVYVGSEIAKGLLMYRLDPRLCGQLHYGHDTEAIK